MYDKNPLAPAGSTGNNTHASLNVGGTYETFAVEFVVEAAGATPTVTWKVQGSPDDPSVADGSSNWYDLGYITDASDTISQAGIVQTAVGAKIIFPSNPLARRYSKFRLVTSSNTNVTYHADLFRIAAD